VDRKPTDGSGGLQRGGLGGIGNREPKARDAGGGERSRRTRGRGWWVQRCWRSEGLVCAMLLEERGAGGCNAVGGARGWCVQRCWEAGAEARNADGRREPRRATLMGGGSRGAQR